MLFTKVGEIGEVMHLAKSGRLIVRLNPESAGIKAGELIVDGAGKRVGRISELVGPVNAPYASVIPMTDRTGRLAGAKVFSGGMVKNRGREKGSRKRTR